MKRIFTKSRLASGCVALALTAGFIPAATSRAGEGFRESNPHENIFLGEISPTTYEFREPGVVGEVEVVRERYADGKVKVERQVTLGADGSYVNHGAWKLFTEMGDVAAEGQYQFGQRTGMWTRWIGRNDAELTSQFPYKQFKAPLMSQVNFTNDKMDGEWIVTDANERKVMAVTLKGGERNGVTTIWLPNGKIYYQMSYENSVPVGNLFEMNPKNGEVEKTATYEQGRKVVTKTEHYYPSNKKVKSEITYLTAVSSAKTQDDFWGTNLARYSADGEDVRNGVAKTWFPNGQQESDGYYTNDKKTGTFKYWHENGQLASSGEYRDDKPEGTWVWWHENGQKSAIGKYTGGALIGEWRWWNEDGKLTKSQSYNGTQATASPTVERKDVSNRVTKGARH